MKTRTLLFRLFIALLFTSNSFGQENAVENLTWTQWYQYPNNFFQLQWQEPAQPHNEILGYNIYRNNELYRFQTENSLYNIYSQVYGYVYNCEIDFLALEPYEENGFEVYVKAVYAGQVESDYLQTVTVHGPVLATANFTQKKALLFPNPTNGILNIGNNNLEKIVIYDISGKVIKEFAPTPQIDLGMISKGLYVIKLFSEKEVIIDKVIID